MRYLRLFRRERSIEKLLRAERREPPRRLVRAIVAETSPVRPRRIPARGAARVAVLSAALAVGLLAVGGLGYAMTAATDFVVKITSSRVIVKHSALRPLVLNAANDQYGTTTTTSGGGGGTSTTTTTTSATTTTAGGTTAVVQPSSTGSVNVSTPGPGNVAVSVAWPAGAFGAAPAKVTVNPAPPVTGTTLIGADNHLVSVTVTNQSTGAPVHTLAAPLDIVFQNAPAGFVPAVSEDGVTFRALTKIDGPPLPADMQDAYYEDSTGVHVLTRHVTIFAVLFKANVNVSESGRKLAAPGSGKWGDPTRIHVGPPALNMVKAPTASGRDVTFTFFVDEQAAMYFHVLSGSTQERIVVGQSAIRAHRLTGPNAKTLHVVVLRPGTITMRLRVNGPAPSKVMVTAVDYDGHKVSATANVG